MSENKTEEPTLDPDKTPDEILQESMGKFSTLIVTGIDDKGVLNMRTSVNSVPMMHWIMNRSIFELGLWEKTASGLNSVTASVDPPPENK